MTYAAIVEYPDAMIEPPSLVIAVDEDELASGVVQALSGLDGMWYADDEEFLSAHPVPSITDPAACKAWLLAMREATTVPWVETYILPDDATLHAAAYPLHTMFGPEESQ